MRSRGGRGRILSIERGVVKWWALGIDVQKARREKSVLSIFSGCEKVCYGMVRGWRCRQIVLFRDKLETTYLDKYYLPIS